MKNIFLTALMAGAFLAVTAAAAEDVGVQTTAEDAARSKVTTTCQNCHGPRGNSTSATFPRLNGQQADYIAAQLKNFRSHSRTDPHAVAYMWGMASQLDDATDRRARQILCQPAADAAPERRRPAEDGKKNLHERRCRRKYSAMPRLATASTAKATA